MGWGKQTCGQEPRGTEKFGSTCKDPSVKRICISDIVKYKQLVVYDFLKSVKCGLGLGLWSQWSKGVVLT